MISLGFLAKLAIAAFITGLILYAWLSNRAHKRRRAKELHERFNPKPSTLSPGARYIDHRHDEPVASFRHAEGSL